MRIQARGIVQVCLIALAGTALWLLCAHDAFAQAGGSAGSFSCSGGKAVGKLYTSTQSCPVTLNFDNIFSFLVCNMEQLSSNLLGNMFCGMITSLAPAVSAVLVIAVTFYGIGFTIGVIPATGRDLQLFLLKIAFVWAFATQSDYLIGYGYNFFVNGIRDGVLIALDGVSGGTVTSGTGSAAAKSGSAVYGQLDAVVAQFIHYGTDYLGFSKPPAGATAVQLAAAKAQSCQNAVFSVLAIMAVAFPPIFYLALMLVGKLALTFVRAVFGYIYALVGIAFLMTLAPFFLSFFLFKQTKPFFDKWIGYLASFSLQIIILFAFLSFILSINVKTITSSFTDIIMYVEETPEGTSMRAPWEYCSLCDFEIKNGTNVLAPNQHGDFLTNGKLVCKKFDAQGNVSSTGKPKAISVLNGAAPSKDQQSALLKFAGSGLLSLVVLAYVIESLLGFVASLSQTLSAGMGASSATRLGGGSDSRDRPGVDLPFEGSIKDFSRGFDRGYHNPDGGSSNSISSGARGFKEGMKRMVGGTGDETGKGDDGESGIKNRVANWFIDPNKLK